MIHFQDGPAHGVMMELQRAPVLLRVVETPVLEPDGLPEFDALDQVDDTPKPEERIHVYVRIGGAGWAHVDFRDKNGRRDSKNVITARYRLYERQPDDADARDTERWRTWAEAQREHLIPNSQPPNPPTEAP
jgi:hypothetical protein